MRAENLLETGSLLLSSLEIDLLKILGAVNCEKKNSLEISVLSVKSSSDDVSPNTTFLDEWQCVLWGFHADFTATGLLNVAVPVDGEGFVATFLLESVVPEEVPGREATGTEEVVFVPVAVIGAVGLTDCGVIVILWGEGWVECWVFLVAWGRLVLIVAV